MLDILFKAVAETLKEFARNPKTRYKEGGKIGFTAVLHTWNQKLRDHFHLHCVIPAGYLSHDEKRWIQAKRKYLFPVKALSRVFRGEFIDLMNVAVRDDEFIFPNQENKISSGYLKLKRQLQSKKWVVYSKQPFGGPKQVFGYLGRYTHRVAISNNRILNMENDTVTFAYNNRKRNKTSSLSLKPNEFIRRFFLHALPKKFMRIRHFGFMANRCKKNSVINCRAIMGKNDVAEIKSEESVKDLMLRLTGVDISQCPFCKKGNLRNLAKIEKHTGPNFFERLNLTAIGDTS